MTVSCRHFRNIVVVAVIAACTPALAKDDERQQQLRRMSQDRDNPRCAAEGPEFVYSAEARTCLRVGGAVGVQGVLTGRP